ncbi:MAG: hypothetical protein Q9185_006377 [Variospora sp. 1 TL-2023]
MEPGTAIAIGQVSAKVVSIIWKYYSDVKDAESNITFLANEIHDFRNVVQSLQDLLQRSSKVSVSAALETTITQALTDINSLETKLDPGTRAKAMRRLGKRALKWPFTKKEVDEWVVRFQRFKATVNLALNTDQTSLILDVDENITQIKQHHDAIEQDQQLAKLPFAADASFDSYHRQHETHCIENTRVELLQKLQTWGASHQRPIYWLSGMAGTGKSTIARTLAARLKASKTLGGSFFFSRSSGEASNAVKFVGTLAHHLANVSPLLKGSICEAISLHEAVTGQGLRNQWREFIVGPLSRVRLSGRPTLNIVVDALDECGSDDDIRLLLQLFVEVKDLTSINMGIFVSSRPDLVIRLGFEDIPEITHQKLDLREIPRHLVEHDILVLLKREFDRIRPERKLPDWPSEQDLQSLVRRSNCLFIYAVTVCRYIINPDWDPEERLSEILDSNLVDGGDTAQLDAVYMQVLSSALLDVRGEEEISRLCDRFKQVVGSIVTLFDELSASALAELLCWPVSSVNTALNRLHSVLNIPGDVESPIRLLHPSFHDFLLSKKRCRDERFCTDETLMHGELFSKCMGAMSTTLKRNACQLSTPGSPPQDVDKKTLDTRVPRHVQYACNYWSDHLARARPDSRMQLGLRDDGKIHVFFKKSFLYWLEAMSLLGKMSHAVLMITQLTSMLDFGNNHSLRAMVEDARRFILNNRGLIEDAPLQAYASALVFAPSESLIRNCYLDQQPSWLNQHSTVERRWGSCIQTVNLFEWVSSLAFSSDGKYIVAGLHRGEIKLLDAATGALHSILEGHSGKVSTMTFMRNGSLASVSEDGTLRLWEPVTGVNRRTMDINFRVSNDSQSSHDFERRTSTFTLATSSPLPAEPSLSVMPSGDVAVLCRDGRLRIWSSEKDFLSDPIFPYIRTSHLYGCLPQGTLVIRSSGEDENAAELLLLDPSTRAAVERIDFDRLDTVKKVAISSANIVALALIDGSLLLYHVVARSFSELGVYASTVYGLGFSPDGSILISTWTNSTIRSWNIKKQVQSLIVSSHRSVPYDLVAVSPDNKQAVISQKFLRTIQIWDISLGETNNLSGLPQAAVQSIEMSPCGKYLATMTREDDTVIRLHDTKTTAEFILLDHHDEVLEIAFSPDDRLLASASSDGTIRLWNTSTGVAGVMLFQKPWSTTELVFSPNGEYLASGNRSGEVRIWDPVSEELQCVFKSREWIKDITFSVDGKQVAVVSRVSMHESWSLDLWDVGMQQLLYHTDDVDMHTSIALSYDSKNIAYKSSNGPLVIYNTQIKKERSIDTGDLQAVAFSKDDKLLATSNLHGFKIELWSTDTLQRTHVIHDCYPYINRLSFTPDGTFLDTNIGLLKIAQTEVGSFAKSRSVWSRNNDWMMEGSRKMLWLPHDWRNRNMEHYNGVFVFKNVLGLGCLGFTQGGPVPGIE